MEDSVGAVFPLHVWSWQEENRKLEIYDILVKMNANAPCISKSNKKRLINITVKIW